MGLLKRKKAVAEDYLEDLNIDGFNETETVIKPEPLETETLENKKQAIENCCDRITSANTRISELKIEYQTVNAYLSDIQILETLPEEQAEEILNCAKKVVVLDKDRRDFGRSMSKLNERQYSHLRENEENISQILKQMAEDEKYCESVKTDMRYLEGERTGLKMELQEQKNLLYLLAGISKIGIVAFVVLMLLFIVLNYGYDKDTSMYIYTLVGVAAVFTAVVFYLQNRTENEMKLTKLRLNRAIGLLNKIKLKYVNIAGRLSYSYEKHGVRSAYQLNKMWGTYLTLKKEREVYNRASVRLIDAEEDLEALISRANVKDANIWVNQAYALVNKGDMEEIKNHLNKQRQKLKHSLDYNSDMIDKSRDEIKTIILSNKEHARELMGILDAYEEDIG